MQETVTALAMFSSNMDALGIPPGAARLDCFLRLPLETQEAIVADFLGPTPEMREPDLSRAQSSRGDDRGESTF